MEVIRHEERDEVAAGVPCPCIALKTERARLCAHFPRGDVLRGTGESFRDKQLLRNCLLNCSLQSTLRRKARLSIMKRACAIPAALALTIFLAAAPTYCSASLHPCSTFTLRGGAASRQPAWSSSPVGIRRPGQSHQQQYPTVIDLDDQIDDSVKTKIDAFLTRDSRNTFIARVYAILSAQLVFTALTMVVFAMNPGMSRWMRQSGSFVPLVSLALSTIAWFCVATSVKARRESPLKWQLLTVFTLGEALSVGFISSFYKFRTVVSAMLATTVATVGVSLYTIMQKNPKYDLSQWGAGLSSCGMIFVVYGLIYLLEVFGILPAGFLPYNDMLYSLLGTVLFSFYLAYHTKLIVAGKHTKYQMNEKDYVFGAMSLYNDVINIFIYILRLIAEDRDDRR